MSPAGSIATAFGDFRLERAGRAVSALRWVVPPSRRRVRPNPWARRLAAALGRYAEGESLAGGIPLAPVGTAFQKRVWRELRRIPPGEVRTYGEIARRIGRPLASRAVGQACKANPIAIFIPCHRVVGGNSIGGYGGASVRGRARKRMLLAIERRGMSR